MTLTTTHRHDYRWPNTDCLVPKAEALNGRCAVAGRLDGLAGRPWCGQDPPSPAGGVARPPVCRDPDPTPAERPWCQRGLLVDAVGRHNKHVFDTEMRHVQKGSSSRLPQSSKPRCNESTDRENPELKNRLQPKGCEKLAKPNFREGVYVKGTVVARVGEAHQQEPSSNQYIDKLCDKYPRPMAVVTATPRDELKRCAYADRYRTTYQSDYCKNADDSARLVGKCDTHDPLVRSAPEWPGESFRSCPCGCGCRVGGGSYGDTPRVRPIACHPKAVSDNFQFSCCKPKKKTGGGGSHMEEVGPPRKIPPWASEYSDGIGRTAKLILEKKLLKSKKNRSNK